MTTARRVRPKTYKSAKRVRVVQTPFDGEPVRGRTFSASQILKRKAFFQALLRD